MKQSTAQEETMFRERERVVAEIAIVTRRD